MDISQFTDKAVVNWQSFNVGSDASVNIVQNNSQSVLLNRVVGNEMSQIRGQINANGQVILVNPNGIVMGPTGRVTASAFTASTFGISDADFQAGQMRFQRSATSGAVVNQGSIESTDAGGYVALIGADVNNQGTITTRQGAVVLAAADAVTLPNVSAINNVSVPLSRNVRLELNPDSFGSASVSNSGVIVTNGGQVLMRAAAVVDAVSKIADATVIQSGSIDTTGVQGGGVDILADNGRIRVSGSIKANSTNGAPGGDVYIGRDQDTNVLAAIGDASGARIESKDGFVETSGQFLKVDGARVIAKDWLLDPTNITIAASDPSGTTYSANFTAGADSVILASDIVASLDAGTSVSIQTGAGVAGAGAGDININADIVKASGASATLTLTAHRDVLLNSSIKTTSGDLNIRLNALAGKVTGAGGLAAGTGGLITVNTATNGELSGIIESGALLKTGAGQTKLSAMNGGTNTFAGGTTISQGTLLLGNGNSRYDRTAGAGAITLGDINTGSSNVSLLLEKGKDVTQDPGKLTRTVTVTNQGTGTVTLGGVSAGGQGWTAFGGPLVLNKNINFSDGTGDRTSIDGLVSGTGNITLTNGRAIMSSSVLNTFTGDFIVNTGTVLQLNSALALSANNNLVNNGSTRLNGGTTLAINTLSGTGTFTSWNLGSGSPAALSLGNSNGSGIYAGTITQSGPVLSVVKNGSGTQTLTGNNTYTGSTTINAGNLQVGNAGITGTLGTGNVINNASLTFNRSNAMTVANLISGTGAVNQIGSNTTTLTANNSYSGATTVSGGGLQIGNGGSTGSLGLGNVTVSNNASLIFNTSTATSVGQTVSGTGNLYANISAGGFSASNLALTGSLSALAAGNITLINTGAVTVAAHSTANNGSIAITTTGGGLTVNVVNGVSGINTHGTGNVTLSGSTAVGTGITLRTNVTASQGTVTLTGTTSSTTTLAAGVLSSANVAAQNITMVASATANSANSVLGYYGAGGSFDASQQLSLTGTSQSAGNGLYSYAGRYTSRTGMTLVGTTASGKAMNFDAGQVITNGASGGIHITASTNGALASQYAVGLRGVTITNGGGDITIESTSGHIMADSGNPAWNLGVLSNRITQNGGGQVLLSTVGDGTLTVPLIVNNGNGNVVVAAGSDLTAGTGTGGQVLTLSGNTITQNGTGKTYIYTGQTNGTGQLSHLSSGFNQLFYQGTSHTLNAQFNTAYSDTITGGPDTQVLFRSATAPTFSLSLNNISKTYGDADPTLAARNTALLNAYTGPATLTTAVAGANSGSNTFAVSSAEVINALTGTARVGNNNVGTDLYTDVSGSAFNTTLSTQPGLDITPRDITLTGITAATKVYDGNTVASINGGTFGNIVSGETLALSGSGYFNSANVNGVSIVTVNDASALTEAAGGTGSWSNYNLTASGFITSSATGKITAAPLMATVNGSSIFVTQNASTAPNMGVRYDGFVGGDSADTALSGTAVRSYSGLSSYPAAATYTGVFGLSTVPSANHGNYTINVVAGDLQVIPADRLLISIGSQSVDYGSQTQANSGMAAIGSVTAVYCLNDSNCNGSNLYSLTTTRLSDTQWKAADNAGGAVLFSTGIAGGDYSSGGYLQVGAYEFTQSPISRESSSGNPVLNFTDTYTNNGFLTVNPLTVTPTLSASDKTFDGNTSVTLSTSVSGRPGDSLSFNHVSASFDSASVGNNKTVTLYGVQLQGTDAANYRLSSPTLTTSASILGLPTTTPGPTPPVVKPVIPGPIAPTPNGGGQTTLDDPSDSNSNPFALSVEADECRLDNLTACECEPNPLDETMDICYVPNRSGQASIAAPRS
jgi:filamentous hemagglutinin family protein